MSKKQIPDRINEIIKISYGNYTPKAYKPFKKLHEAIRKGLNNDEKFLEFLEAQIKDRPVYSIPFVKP